MTPVRKKVLTWSKISTALLLATVAGCGVLGSLAFLHRLAVHPVPVSGYAVLLPTAYHFTWVWSGRFFVAFFIVCTALLAHSLARLAQYGCASLRRN